jgi:hypothetical protein
MNAAPAGRQGERAPRPQAVGTVGRLLSVILVSAYLLLVLIGLRVSLLFHPDTYRAPKP